ncbi:MAG: 30S ribosomal protein S17 [Thermodesulfobacteriota bacterium]
MADKATSRKKRVGTVVSDKMENTIVVQATQLKKHKLYGKILRRNVKYVADDPQNTCKIGDRVLIEECRPLSKTKRWRVRAIIEKAV